MSLTVRREDDRWCWRSSTTGVGFDPARGARPTATSACAPRTSLVREHGGTLEVESAPGSGTIVRVEVPAG